jgi:antitoxin (DNA-binding transcriptional repressor) of toxin-antitoxin stability system
MKKLILHFSETEAAATNVTALLARGRAGTEIIIENEKRPIAVIRPVEPAHRTITECIALLPESSTATIDPDFSGDVRAAVEGHGEPFSPPA